VHPNTARDFSPQKAIILAALFFFAGLALFPHSTDAATTLVKPPNNLGLVGYWSFNEGTSTTATDFSGNGNKGTLSTNGGSLPTWTNGKLSTALNFDGSTSYVQVADSPTLNTPNVTVSAWIRANSWGAFNRRIVTKGIGNQYDLFNNSGVLDWYLVDNAGANFSDVSTTLPSTGVWHHIVGTYDGTTNALYVDGVLANSESPGGGPIATNKTDPLFIAARDACDNPGDCFDGKIDEVRIYNRALTASEVAKLYQSGAVKINASSADLDNGSSLENGLVANWTFDGKDLTDKVYDVSGNGNHGVIITSDGSAHTATTSMKVLGKLGQALRFVDFGGGDGDVVDIPNSGTVADNLTNISVGVWFKAPVGAANNSFVTKMNTGQFRGWSFGIVSAGRIEFQVSQDDTNNHGRITSSSFDDNQWHHAVATLSGGANGTITIYVDGVSQSTGADDSGTPSTYTAPHDIWIGNHILSAAFNGPLDDLRIYNRALSPGEVWQLYKLGSVNIH
jgi:hypothetical protein